MGNGGDIQREDRRDLKVSHAPPGTELTIVTGVPPNAMGPASWL